MGRLLLAGVIIGLAALVARLRALWRKPQPFTCDHDWRCRYQEGIHWHKCSQCLASWLRGPAWLEHSPEPDEMAGVQVDLRPYYASSVAPAYEVARNYTGGNAA